MLFRLLIVIQKSAVRRHIQTALTLPDVMVQTLGPRNHLWQHLAGLNVDCVILDKTLVPAPVNQNIKTLLDLPDPPSVVILSEQENAEERAGFLAAGCEAVLNPGLPAETLREVFSVILDRRRARRVEDLATRRLTSQARLTDFVTHSPVMQSFMNVVLRVVQSDAPLLIQGETGVGKERLARAIHTEGPRSSGPFIAVNCGALPESLLESELFGHEIGAFTGATRTRRGCFELAHRGTLFLDEITEMPLHLQVRLLRVLQDYEFQPVGAEKTIKVSVRVMASTNKNMEEEVQAGRFRKDLFYRLSVVSLTVPPLRQRREDIPALVENYISLFRSRIGSDVYSVHPEAMKALCEYSWPGNVRELINVLERATLLCTQDQIRQEDLPESIRSNVKESFPVLSLSVNGTLINSTDAFPLLPWRKMRRMLLEHGERQYLVELLKSTHGHIGQTAKHAGMQPRSLFDKMKKYGLRKEDYRK
ncbi:MAG: sigma-54-dependent Fis family transcriptional regulator [Sedimentisphaerales bacterium]|nr:sigma-54-dependent Fis family transcriptional regulator [Sedimentisphaerales bacterium]